MSKGRRLLTLKKLAGNQEAAAMRRLGASVAEIGAREGELARLRSYLADYQTVSVRESAMDALQWQNLRLFVSRLTEAIRQRESELERLREQHEIELEQWRASRGRTQAFEQLLDWHRQENRRLAEIREQKDLDEQNGLRQLMR